MKISFRVDFSYVHAWIIRVGTNINLRVFLFINYSEASFAVMLTLIPCTLFAAYFRNAWFVNYLRTILRGRFLPIFLDDLACLFIRLFLLVLWFRYRF